MLLGEVGQHGGACFSHNTSISKYVGGSDEALGGAGDEGANARQQSVLALDSILAESLH